MHHLLAFPLGVLAGLVTGLVPGLHVNLAVFIIIGAGLDAVVPGEAITIFVIALAMTQVLVGFVPAVFLRVPSADNAVATFPGDRLLQRGEGPSAVVAAQTGALYATLAAAVLALVLFLAAPGLLPWLERALKPFLGWVLLAILAWFVVRDLDFAAARAGRWGRFLSHAALAIAGFVLLAQLSEVALSGLPGSPEQGIMAAFSGMFGAATLLASGVAGLRSTAAVAQRPAERIGASAAAVPCALGAAGGTVVGLLPAVGTAEMSAALCAVSDRLMPVATRRLGPDRRYLLMVGAVAAADALLAVAAIFLIGKARSGASIGVEHVLGDRIAASTDGEVRGLLLRLILCGAVASYLAYLAGGWLADAAGRRYSRVDPAAIPRAVSLALSVFVTLTGGPGALLIFLAAASIGILFLRIGLRPASLMAFLLVPSIHFFLGFRLPGLPPVRLETVAIHAIPGTTEALTAIVVAIGVGTCTYGWLARRGGP